MMIGFADVLVPLSTIEERQSVAQKVEKWIKSAKEYSVSWSQIGIESDRRPILNSPLIGLFDDEEDAPRGEKFDHEYSSFKAI